MSEFSLRKCSVQIIFCDADVRADSRKALASFPPRNSGKFEARCSLLGLRSLVHGEIRVYAPGAHPSY